MHPSPMDGDACPILVICVSFVILVNTVILVILANIAVTTKRICNCEKRIY